MFRYLFVLIATLSAIRPWCCLADDQPSLTSPHSKVTLISDSKGYTPGETMRLGFYFQLDPEWHVYWKNPGDSGSSPKFDFESQESFSPGEIKWPTPERIEVSTLLNYGYPDEVLLVFPVTAGTHTKGTQILKIHAEWLVCKEDCIPGEGDMTLTLKENNQVVPSEWQELFKKYQSKIPPRFHLDNAVAQFNAESVRLDIPEELSSKEIFFIPDTMGIVENVKDQRVEIKNGHTSIELPRARSHKEPQQFGGILSLDNTPHEITFTSLTSASAVNESANTFLQYILFAFIGGILLNLMPCVFPVIGIKVLALFEEAEMKGRSRLLYVLFYELGIAASLWALFLIVIIAKSFGTQLGWGFQLQEPLFVAFLALFFLMLGYNFLGFIEFHAAFRTKKKKERHYIIEAFFSGLLTTVVATPCTAPFMGTSIAFALQADTIVGFLIFTFLALGLGLPYLLFALFPQTLAILPKPGAWMNIVKKILAFPLFAAFLWLLWVLGQQCGSDGVIRVLVASLIASFAVWFKHEFGSLHASAMSRKVSSLIFISLMCFAGYWMLNLPVQQRVEGDSVYIDGHGLRWENYNKELIERLLGMGKTVYLDLTASWCVTCQVNKTVVFGSKEVRDYVDANNIVLVRGDWTTQDPVITELIQSYGKAGVPLNIVLKPLKPPVILPTVLTPSIVLEELRKN